MISGLGPAVSPLIQQLTTKDSSSGASAGSSSFGDALQSAMADVDALHGTADQQIASLLQGKGNVDAGQVSFAVEKADVAFQLMLQVRNKIVSAYQDMEKLQF